MCRWARRLCRVKLTATCGARSALRRRSLSSERRLNASTASANILDDKNFVITGKRALYFRHFRLDEAAETGVFDQTCIVWSQARALQWARLIVRPPPLLPSHRPTPPQADGQRSPLYPPLPSFISFRAACEDLRSSSLAGQKHPSLLPRLVWNVGNIKFVFPWTWTLIRPLHLRTQWTRSKRRWQF